MPMLNTDFIVNKQNLSETRYVETELPDSTELTPGQALLKVDEFALTANNITYGVAGEFLRYWDFFPTEVGRARPHNPLLIYGYGRPPTGKIAHL